MVWLWYRLEKYLALLFFIMIMILFSKFIKPSGLHSYVLSILLKASVKGVLYTIVCSICPINISDFYFFIYFYNRALYLQTIKRTLHTVFTTQMLQLVMGSVHSCSFFQVNRY